jgi:hypothetical protein
MGRGERPMVHGCGIIDAGDPGCASSAFLNFFDGLAPSMCRLTIAAIVAQKCPNKAYQVLSTTIARSSRTPKN